jgi:serine/threonine protein kinase
MPGLPRHALNQQCGYDRGQPMSEPREITENFRLERVLKSSKSAIVFQAVDPGTGNVVAIKLIPPGAVAEPRVCQSRFLAAMAALASLRPPAFPLLLDHGFTPDGSAFMVMELVTGEHLEASAGASPTRVIRLVLEAIDGLEKLAERGIAHGNLAPDNLLVSRRGDHEEVKVLGFGTAAFQVGAMAGAGLSLAEGPAQFAAPERLEPATAEREPDFRSDLYSLALTTCALLGADSAPADAPTPSVVLPPQVNQRLIDPVVLRAILEQSLRRDPATRPGSLDEFRQALELALFGVNSRAAALSEPDLEEPFGPVAGEPPGPQAFAPPPAPVVVPPTAPAAPSALTPPKKEKERTGPVPIHRLPEIPTPPFVPAVEPPELAPTLAAAESTDVTVPVAEAAPQPAAAPVRSATHRRRGSAWRALLWASLAALLVGAVAAGWFAFRDRLIRPRQRVAAVPTPVRVRPTPVPQPTAQPQAVTQLQNAEAAIALGDLVAARQALDAITPAELEALTEAERERYTSLRAAYTAQVEQTLAKELASSLAAGNLKAVAETVKGISKQDEATFRGNRDFSAALEEARRALNVQSLMVKAQRRGDWGDVLQQSTVLVSLVPKYTQATELREKAAVTLEREADTLAAGGNYELAQARLEALRRNWPDRKGLTDRFERITADRAAEQQLASVLATADQSEKDQTPEKGLAALAAATPGPRWEERFRQTRERLASQLAQLDAAAPTVVLTPGAKLEYKKGEAGTISVRIQDDHGIKSARLFARVEGSVQYVELPLRSAGASDYVAQISPSFHQNQTVEFYVVAADYSDHTTQLGSAQQPLKLKRKRWSLFGG